jgi:hypothetical protein
MLWAPCRRTIAAVFAAWSFVVQEEPAALHACAMHDGVAHVAGPAAAGVSHAPQRITPPAPRPGQRAIATTLTIRIAVRARARAVIRLPSQ